MAKYTLDLTNAYLHDLKLARKRGLDEASLNEVINKLLDDIPLPPNNRNHQLVGDYKGCWECHINPDWLLIYSKDKQIKIITLKRTGTHSDLFKNK